MRRSMRTAGRAISASVGARRVTVFSAASVEARLVGGLHQHAAADPFDLEPRDARRRVRRTRSKRTFFLRAATSRHPRRSRAQSPLRRIAARRSHSTSPRRAAIERDDAAVCGRRISRDMRVRMRRADSAAIATPHGFACLTMTHAGSSKTRTHSSAASVSATLLYDSSLPCSCRAAGHRSRRRAAALGIQRRDADADFRRNAVVSRFVELQMSADPETLLAAADRYAATAAS